MSQSNLHGNGAWIGLHLLATQPISRINIKLEQHQPTPLP